MNVVGSASPESVFKTYINTIKLLREKTGWSLKDLKEAVDAYLRHHGYSRDSVTGMWIEPTKKESLQG